MSYFEVSAAALARDLRIGEKRHQRMGAHRDDGTGFEGDQHLALLRVKRKRSA